MSAIKVVMTHRVPDLLYQRLKRKASAEGLTVNGMYTGLMQLFAEGRVFILASPSEWGEPLQVRGVDVRQEQSGPSFVHFAIKRAEKRADTSCVGDQQVLHLDATKNPSAEALC